MTRSSRPGPFSSPRADVTGRAARRRRAPLPTRQGRRRQTPPPSPWTPSPPRWSNVSSASTSAVRDRRELTHDGIPSPSDHDPSRNRYRAASRGESAIKAMLANARYTAGHARSWSNLGLIADTLSGDMDLGSAVRRARRRAGLSQRALAARSGVAQPTIARIERGRDDPRISTVERLLVACGESIEVVPRTGVGVDRSEIRALLASPLRSG